MKMEFTPKKQVITNMNMRPGRLTPYSNSDKTHCNKFRKRINQPSSPWPSRGKHSPQTYSQKRFSSRADRIVNLTKKFAHSDNVTASNEKVIKSSPSPKSNKRPLSDANIVECMNDQIFPKATVDVDTDDVDAKKIHIEENDPYDIHSHFDHELTDKRAKLDGDKENTFSTPRRINVNVKLYPSKKKQAETSRSRLLADISPEKVEKVYGSSYKSDSEKVYVSSYKSDSEKVYGSSYKSEAEKENVPADTTRALLPLPEPATTLPHLIGFPNYGNTCYLNSVVQALFGLSPFLGDLQVVSSQLNLAATSLSSGLNEVITARTKGQVALVKQSLKTVKENLVRVDESFSGYKMQDANEFLTRILDTIKDEIDRCHMTTPSPERSITSRDDSDDETLPNLNCPKITSVGKIFEDEISTTSKDKDSTVNGKGCDEDEGTTQRPCEIEESTISPRVSPAGGSEDVRLQSCPTQSLTPNKGSDEDPLPRNPIKDNFEFQLFESYRCLGCNEVEGRKQEYFGLYVNLPEDHENIQDAISTFMGEDERELKCEKCGHNRSSVVTSVTRLPRILIVQLKRYEYKADQGESIKRSSKVPVTRWLTFDEYVTLDVSEPSWTPCSGNVVPRASKQTTLTVRNLSSELNVCEGQKEQEEAQVCSTPSPTKPVENAEPPPTAEREEEELQEVMRRSMDDIGGAREEDEIQQAIRLSLQDLGMSYAPDNQIQNNEDQDEDEMGVEEEEGNAAEVEGASEEKEENEARVDGSREEEEEEE